MKRNVIAVVLLCLFVIGCEVQEEAGYYEKLSNVIVESADAQQEATRVIVSAIRDSQLVGDEKIVEFELTLDKIDKYVDTAKVAAVEAAKVYEEKRADGQLTAAIEAIRAANIASTPVNPYAPLIEGILGVVAIVAGGYGVTKARQATALGKKYKAHKRGVDMIMVKSGPTDASAMYEAIGFERKKLGIQ